ncbi:MAG: NAD(P)/FAD-dependent oxidoreductase [Synechococcaceae cyanobacterium ELA182]
MSPDPAPSLGPGGLLTCEVLVVGAGPAGGDLAAQLARAGIDVCLVDQLQDLTKSAFSSAGMPLAAMPRYGLPAELVGARWDSWRLIGPGDQWRDWSATAPLGVVLQFGALRRWLADQCQSWGGTVRLGRRAVAISHEAEALVTRLRGRDGQMETVRSAWVVDATGHSRSLIGDPEPVPGPRGRDRNLISAVGVEWLMQVPEATWEHWRGKLSFCLGSDWVPQGYGWVFPMQRGQIKLGVCRLENPGQVASPLAPLMQSLQHRLLDPQCRGGLQVLDRHGGRVRSSVKRQEPHRRGRLIALGDAVSTANLLGGEGIRHALESSRVLAPLLSEAVRIDRAGHGRAGAMKALDRYPRHLHRALGWRWSLSGRIARRTWSSLTGARGDERLSRVLKGLEQQRAEDLSALLFDYRFERYGARMLPYLLGWR